MPLYVTQNASPGICQKGPPKRRLLIRCSDSEISLQYYFLFSVTDVWVLDIVSEMREKEVVTEVRTGRLIEIHCFSFDGMKDNDIILSNLCLLFLKWHEGSQFMTKNYILEKRRFEMYYSYLKYLTYSLAFFQKKNHVVLFCFFIYT